MLSRDWPKETTRNSINIDVKPRSAWRGARKTFQEHLDISLISPRQKPHSISFHPSFLLTGLKKSYGPVIGKRQAC